MKTHPLRSLLASLALATTLSAQTWTGGTSLNWDDAANWDPAVVPEGAGVTATFTPAGLGPNTTDLTLTGEHTLAGIHFAANTPAIVLFTDNTAGPAGLTLEGDGLRNDSTTRQSLWLSSVNFTGTQPASLTFRNQATVTGDIKLIGIGSDRTIAFRDQSSAGSALFFAYVTDFYDSSTAGAAVFDQTLSVNATFHDHATAGTAQLPSLYGSVTFADFSSADHASVVRSTQSGSTTQVFFRDQARAGHGVFSVGKVEFAGSSSAESATISNLGVQYYSSHGQYATTPATLTFRDTASAGQASISVNPLGTTTWTDDATADHATISSTGTVVWSGRAAFADAKLVAGSGSYYGLAEYNQQAPSIPTGSVTFKDQAIGGAGRIEIASAGAWLDFSGLYSGTGTTGRAAVSATSTNPAIVADDERIITLGVITNTVAGGTLYLGSTALRLGVLDQDMTLSALIRDTGGAYGSAAGDPLRGGSLIKTGTGTLTLSNPANDYSGPTLVTMGTVNLAGGRINDAQVSDFGRLTGSGTVRGSLTNSGLVSPGNSPGTITVTGDYTQTAGGKLAIEVGSTTSYDRLAIAGTATLAGTLELATLNGYVPVGSTNYDFLTAGAVHGQFDAVTAPGFGAALASQLAYTPTGVRVQVTQRPFAGFGGGSPAGVALGAHLDATLGTATGDYRDLVASLNTLSSSATIANALDALAPDRYAALADHAFLSAAALQAAQDRRLAVLRDPATHGFEAFFVAGQRRARFDAAPGLPAARSSVGGGTAGGAWTNAGFTLGAAVTREDGDLDLDDIGSKADLRSTLPSLFFQYAGDLGFVSATASFGQDDYDLRRHVAYAGVDRTAAATPSGTRHDFGVTVGREIPFAAWTFTPQAGVLASRWQVDRFTETGAAGANLTIPDQSLRSLRSRVGFDLAGRSGRFTPRLAVFWLHESGDDRTLQAAFAGASGSPYTAPGRRADANQIQASLGFDWQLSRHAALQVTVAGLRGSNSRVTSDLSAGFRWRF